MNKQTIITALVALVAMSADAQRLNKDVERLQYVYALKVVINDSVWSGFADKQYDVPLLYYGDTCCYVVNPTEKFLDKYPSVLIHRDYNIQIYQTEKVDDKPFHMHVTFTDEESNIDYRTHYSKCHFSQRMGHDGDARVFSWLPVQERWLSGYLRYNYQCGFARHSNRISRQP